MVEVSETEPLVDDESAGSLDVNEPPVTRLEAVEGTVSEGDHQDEATREGIDHLREPEERRRWQNDPRNAERQRYEHDQFADDQVRNAFAFEDNTFGPLTLKRINGDGLTNLMNEQNGRTTNCGECARAVASTLDGHPRAADAIDVGEAEPEGENLVPMETWTGREFSEPAVPADAKVALEQHLRDEGHGAHVIICCEWKTRRQRRAEITGEDPTDMNDPVLDERSGHYFNAVNRDGEIIYIDGQADKVSPELGIDYERQSTMWQWVDGSGPDGGER